VQINALCYHCGARDHDKTIVVVPKMRNSSRYHIVDVILAGMLDVDAYCTKIGELFCNAFRIAPKRSPNN
jgi:hypothetical protein